MIFLLSLYSRKEKCRRMNYKNRKERLHVNANNHLVSITIVTVSATVWSVVSNANVRTATTFKRMKTKQMKSVQNYYKGMQKLLTLKSRWNMEEWRCIPRVVGALRVNVSKSIVNANRLILFVISCVGVLGVRISYLIRRNHNPLISSLLKILVFFKIKIILLPKKLLNEIDYTIHLIKLIYIINVFEVYYIYLINWFNIKTAYFRSIYSLWTKVFHLFY